MGAWRERFFLPLSQSRWSWLLARFHPQLTPSDGGPAMLPGLGKQNNLKNSARNARAEIIRGRVAMIQCFLSCFACLRGALLYTLPLLIFVRFKVLVFCNTLEEGIGRLSLMKPCEIHDASVVPMVGQVKQDV